MENQIIDINLADGTTTKMTVFTSGATENRPVVVIFPAMGVEASYYKRFATGLVQQNMIAMTVDLRGHGHSSVRPSRQVDFGYHEMIEIDYQGVMAKINELYANHPKFLLGHSLGGQIGSLFLSKHPVGFSGLILIACCSVYYKSWKGRSKYSIWGGTQVSRMVASMVGYYPGKKLGFAGTEAKTVMKDWSRQARTGKYIIDNSSYDFEASLKKLNLPVLVISFKGDNLAPKPAVQHLYQKFSPDAKIEHHHLGENESVRYTHFNWVKKSERTIELISKFV